MQNSSYDNDKNHKICLSKLHAFGIIVTLATISFMLGAAVSRWAQLFSAEYTAMYLQRAVIEISERLPCGNCDSLANPIRKFTLSRHKIGDASNLLEQLQKLPKPRTPTKKETNKDGNN